MRPLLVPTILLAALPSLVAASTVFTTNTTVNGFPVNASATFTPGNGTTTIVLANLLANPTDVDQTISAIAFDITGFNQVSASLTSSSGQNVTINSDGSFSLGPTGISTGWTAGWDFVSQTIVVCDTCASPVSGGSFPANLLIGPPGSGGKYSNADSTIAGTGVYNPFLFETATFTISTPGTTVNSVVSNVDFTVGPRFGVEVPGTTGGGGGTGGGMTPEPATFILAGAGFILAGLVGRRRSRR